MNKNLTAVVLIVVSVGVYFTIIDPLIADAGKIQQTNAQYVSAIDMANRLLTLRDQVVSDYNNLPATDKARLSKMLPSSVDNIRLVIDMNSIAQKHGLVLTGLTATADTNTQTTPTQAPQVVVLANGLQKADPIGGGLPSAIPAPTLDVVTLSFAVDAPLLQFQSFLQDLEANLRIMDVTHLAMTASDTGGYSFQVTLRTYWLKNP